ncbi:glycosyltransferase [Mycobacterium sp. C31M]
MTVTIRHVEVVIPARDEEEHIHACLGSLRDSAALLRTENTGVTCGVTVVLDRCSDSTGAIAAAAGAHVVHCDAGNVGSARRVGTADAIRRARLAGVEEAALWIANTDADTRVPATWLHTQLALADSGTDAVIGTVIPGDVTPEVYRLWLQNYELTEGHRHVHGANLGVRASVYAGAGGFCESELGEDVDLVQRIRAFSTRWIATHETSVLTSGRTVSRVVGGFASHLAGLGVEAT